MRPRPCEIVETNSEFHPAKRDAHTVPYASDVYASGTVYAKIMYFLSGQCQPKDRKSRRRMRQVTNAAKAGHHMIAGSTNPDPMYKCPDQMIRVHGPALNTTVSLRKI